MTYVLALDVGTSSVRAALYDERGEALPGLSAARSHSPETTPDGGVQMDAEELFQRVARTLAAVERTYGASMEVLSHGGMPVVVERYPEVAEVAAVGEGEGHHGHPA